MKVTHKSLTFQKITHILTHAATGVAVVTDCSLIETDMVYSLYHLRETMYKGLNFPPYYIAIRTSGVECGTKQECMSRCKGLGNPIIIARISLSEAYDYEMSIRYTSENETIEEIFND